MAPPAGGDEVRLLDLIPERMPPTRTTCEVRTVHLTIAVEWNPEDFSHLRQRVSLPKGTKEVTIQCWSASPGKDSKVSSWSSWSFAEKTIDLSGANAQALVDTIAGAPSDARIKVRASSLPKIQDRLVVLDTQLAGDASVRSLFSPVPEAVAQTAKVLGDIALKRAKAHAREMLMDRMTNAVCAEGESDGDTLVPKYWLNLPEEFGGLTEGTHEYELTWDELASKWILKGAPYCQGETPYGKGAPNAKVCKGWPEFVPPEVPPVDRKASVVVTKKKNGKLKSTQYGGVMYGLKVRLPHTCQLVRGRSFVDLARSGPEIARALEADALTMLVDLLTVLSRYPKDFPEFPKNIIPLLELVLPVLVDAAKESRAPTAREALTILTSVRQSLQSDSYSGDSRHHLNLALAIVADCVETGACDLRLVSAKIAEPQQYYAMDSVWPAIATKQQQQELVRIVDGLYALFAPNPAIKDRDRAASAIGAVFRTISYIVTTDVKKSENQHQQQALRDTLNALERLVLASIRDDYGAMLAEAGTMLSGIIRMNAYTADCRAPGSATRSDKRRQCPDTLLRFARRIERALPWITTLAAQAVQIRDERDASLTEAELKQNAEARKKALEELIDQSTNRRGRGGDWVWSFGAGVGARAAGTVGSVRRFVETPLTLPIGVAVQWLPGPAWRSRSEQLRDRRLKALQERGTLPSKEIGVGLHFQASPVDVGQYVFLSEDISGVTWSQFLSANGQIGVLVGSSRTNIVIAVDYRYVPARPAGSRHELGLALTYYIPFFDFN